MAAVGAPAASFRFLALYSWEPLGECALAVDTRSNETWLLDVVAGCRELAFANSIGLSPSLNQVTVRFGKVLAGQHDFSCTIARLRPVDVKRLQAMQQQPREIRSRPRSVDKDATH